MKEKLAIAFYKNPNEILNPGVSKLLPWGRMQPAALFCVACGSLKKALALESRLNYFALKDAAL